MLRNFNKSILLTLVFALCLSSTVFAASETNHYESLPLEGVISASDLGGNPEKIVNTADMEKIDKLFEEKTRLAMEGQAILEDVALSANEKEKLMARITSADSKIERELEMLGAVKLTGKEKKEYLLTVAQSSLLSNDIFEDFVEHMASTNSINYDPVPGISFHITYFNHTVNGQTHQLGRVFATPVPNVTSKMNRNYDAVEMFNNVTWRDMGSTFLRSTVDNAIGSLLPTGVSFGASVIRDLVSPIIPSSQYSNTASLTLKVSTSANVSHIWKKENNEYYFKLATNRALIRETWLFVDVNMKHHNVYNEFWAESDNYDSRNLAAQVNNPVSYGISFNYQTRGLLNLFWTQLSVSPFHAGLPIHFY